MRFVIYGYGAFVIVLYIFISMEYVTNDGVALEVNFPDENITSSEVPGCNISINAESNTYSASCTVMSTSEGPDFLPEEIKQLYISSVTITQINVPIARHLRFLEELELSNNQLQNLTKYMLEGLTNLRKLSVINNSLTSLPHDVFIYNNLLESIDLSGNYLESISTISAALSHFEHLRELKLSLNYITEVTYESLIPLANSSLKVLTISECRIRRIDEDSFAPLKRLTFLDFSLNPLNEKCVFNITNAIQTTGIIRNLKTLKLNDLIETGYIPHRFLRVLNMSSVEVLELKHNTLINFPSASYHFPQLKVLEISSCDIDKLSAHMFDYFSSLEILAMQDNAMTLIPKHALRLPSLKVLEFSRRKKRAILMTVEDYAFQELPNLEILHLNYVKIMHPLKRYMLYGLSRLTYLSLASCSLTLINDYSFETLQNLWTLDLSYNMIGILSNNTFYGLQSLRTISLFQNSIRYFISSYPFQYTPNLLSIDLRHNKIIQFPSGLFVSLSDLKYLHLGNNFIKPWEDQLLPRSGNMKYLNIRENNITYFTQAMFEDVEKLEILIAYFNPFNCSHCSLREFKSWLVNTKVRAKESKINYWQSTLLYCRYPPSVERQPLYNVTIENAHCLPLEVDILVVSFCTISPVVCVIIIAALVWHKWRWNIRYCCFQAWFRVRKYKQKSKKDKYLYDCFVSYSDQDVQWISEKLVPELEGKEPRLHLCLSDRDFDASEYIANNILKAIEKSRTIILALSNHYMDSNWCLFAMETAEHKLIEESRNGLLLVLLEDIEKSKMTNNLKYVLRTRTVIQWTENSVGQKLFLERLRAAIVKPGKAFFSHIT